MQLIIVFTASMVSLGFFHEIMGKAELWDSKSFCWIYLFLISLSTFFGALFRKNYFIWGWIILFSELPIMMWDSGLSSLWAIGLLFLFVLSIPIVGAAWIAAKIASRNVKRLD